MDGPTEFVSRGALPLPTRSFRPSSLDPSAPQARGPAVPRPASTPFPRVPFHWSAPVWPLFSGRFALFRCRVTMACRSDAAVGQRAKTSGDHRRKPSPLPIARIFHTPCETCAPPGPWPLLDSVTKTGYFSLRIKWQSPMVSIEKSIISRIPADAAHVHRKAAALQRNPAATGAHRGDTQPRVERRRPCAGLSLFHGVE